MIPLLVAVVLVVGCSTQMTPKEIQQCRQDLQSILNIKDALRHIIKHSDDQHVRELALIQLGEYIDKTKPYNDHHLLSCWSEP